MPREREHVGTEKSGLLLVHKYNTNSYVLTIDRLAGSFLSSSSLENMRIKFEIHGNIELTVMLMLAFLVRCSGTGEQFM